MPYGLYRRGKYYHVDTTYRGRELRQSTGCDKLSAAIEWLDARKRKIFDYQIHGVTPSSKKVWKDGEEAYVTRKLKNKPQANEHVHLRILSKYIPGNTPLNNICDETFKLFREDSFAAGKKHSSINRTLEVARAVLRYCCTQGSESSPWRIRPPHILMEKRDDLRKPWILDSDDEEKLLDALPDHLSDIALLILQTALRSGEALKLKWEWLHHVPGIGSVFIIPGSEHKNGEAKPVYLNPVAEEIVRKRRGQHPTHIFHYEGTPLSKLARTAWHKACRKAGLWREVDGKPYYPIPHDLRKTVNTRLKHIGISLLTRKVILGHTVGDITEDVYTKPTLEPIKQALDQLIITENFTPSNMTLLR